MGSGHIETRLQRLERLADERRSRITCPRCGVPAHLRFQPDPGVARFFCACGKQLDDKPASYVKTIVGIRQEAI